MVAGPEISRMVHEFQNSHQTPNKHHKQNPRIQKTFAGRFVPGINNLGHGEPALEDSSDFVTLDANIITSA